MHSVNHKIYVTSIEPISKYSRFSTYNNILLIAYKCFWEAKLKNVKELLKNTTVLNGAGMLYNIDLIFFFEYFLTMSRKMDQSMRVKPKKYKCVTRIIIYFLRDQVKSSCMCLIKGSVSHICFFNCQKC